MDDLAKGEAAGDRRQGERRRSDRRSDDIPIMLEWSEKFATGIRAIDNDHQQLFEEFKILSEQFARAEPDTRNLEWIIKSLRRYVSEHFAREEGFMESAHYPDLDAHKAEHRKTTEAIVELERLFANDPDSIDGSKVVRFLGKWLTSHILGSDMRYVPYLRGEVGEVFDPDVDLGEEPSPEPEAVELRLSPTNAETVRAIAGILADGGQMAAALREAINQYSAKRAAKVHDSAVQLFCKD